MLTRLRALLLAIALALTCEVSAAAADAVSLPAFSTQPAGPNVSGWTAYTLGGKAAPADFRLAELDGLTVLRVEASNAASALIHTRRFDPLATPWLNWRWRADVLPAAGRFATREGDDYALRVYVLFDLDLSKLSFGTRTKIRLARTFYGEQIPTAVLCYVWDTRAAPGSRAWSAYTDRVRMIAVDGAGSPTGSWRDVSRNLVEDFREAFGEDPPAVTGIVVASDSDNTGGQTLGYFGDLSVTARSPLKPPP
ncbi:DUF3047 domain-containing protein [Methyloversatilis sp. XJ19-13]|uniref:DUF3047 domain-containing protein n=1 Tax=Methyloversatilis sp. XJ19-13 TaxID=2963430 RepID=UPI00211C5707|nr:DUF3047 domain-containing protein [Methyloversatilis sp. XJ19-13]